MTFRYQESWQRGERGVVRGEGKKIMNRKIDEKTTMQVVIDKGLHRLLKIESAKTGKTIRELVEECLAEYLAIDIDNEK